ncbi:septal ring lytic transglycosylase RlpA family protein [Zhongshania sp. BJYM1]|uniref:septal ring lytic transglycosylase RlpA family protein n=1 Tax=Zhongshania aquatica TaxID=2965069 RepID=UPI0022B4EA07|nr:septal ring lytic transglycosylase RlpA family protein [Marortus sp. BJYM1]
MSKTLSYRIDLVERPRERVARDNGALIIITMFALLLSLAGCSSTQFHENSGEGSVAIIESGMASYYGDKYHNKKTASGERYRHELNTAAHRTLPFGTHVKVTNQKTGQSVLVKINDRGPFVRGRIIDLSKSAFTTIGDTSSGLIRVDVQVVE